MFLTSFLKKNTNQVKRGGFLILIKKFITFSKLVLQLPLYFLYLPIMILIYLISPIILIRFSPLRSRRIGPLAVTTELYFCERDAKINQPKKKYLDLFFFPYRSIANNQLAKMWKRSLNTLPEFIISPFYYINKFVSTFFNFAKRNDISQSSTGLNNEHDIYNLLEKFKPHLQFTKNEEEQGKNYLKQFGFKDGDKYVCLIARDEKYLEGFDYTDFSYHKHRNINIDKFILAAEELAKRGYFIFRMGKKVDKPLKSKNPKIIDYAYSNQRNDFLDIYLGANCSFCLSSHTGFDNVPLIFRKPIVYISIPIASFFTHCKNSIVITRHHYSIEKKRNLTLSEIVSSEIARTQGIYAFNKLGINILEPLAEDIRDASIEMADRLEGKWKDKSEDIELQKKFWKIYSSSPFTKEFSSEHKILKVSRKIHGEIKIKFGSKFLRNNIEWLN